MGGNYSVPMVFETIQFLSLPFHFNFHPENSPTVTKSSHKSWKRLSMKIISEMTIFRFTSKTRVSLKAFWYAFRSILWVQRFFVLLRLKSFWANINFSKGWKNPIFFTTKDSQYERWMLTLIAAVIWIEADPFVRVHLRGALSCFSSFGFAFLMIFLFSLRSLDIICFTFLFILSKNISLVVSAVILV